MFLVLLINDKQHAQRQGYPRRRILKAARHNNHQSEDPPKLSA
jgi:hypothetical protein